MQSNLEKNQRSDSLNDSMVDCMYFEISRAGTDLSEYYFRLSNSDKGSAYFEKAMSYGMRVTEEKARATLLYEALMVKGKNLDS